MKTFRYIIGLAAAILVLQACKDDLKEVTMLPDEDVVPAVLAAYTGSTITITEVNVDDNSVEFSWTPADYGFNSAPTYILYAQIGDEDPVVVMSGFGKSFEVTYSDLNAKVVSAGAEAGEDNVVNFYVGSRISTGATIIESNRITITVNPYAADYVLYMVGQNNDWVLDESAPKLYSIDGKSTGVFEGYLNFGTYTYQGFRFFYALDWASSYGAATDLAELSTGLVYGSDKNFTIAEGFYYLSADLTALTCSTRTVTAIGLIGSMAASNWNTDLPFVQDTANPYIWTVTGVSIASGDSFKIRFDNDLAISLGLSDVQDTEGNLSDSGGNIAVAAGTYDFTLDMSVLPVKLSVVSQ